MDKVTQIIKVERYLDIVVFEPPEDQKSAIIFDIAKEEKQTKFDLVEVFPAADLLSLMGMLKFEAVENSNPNLVNTVFEGSTLILSFPSQEIGNANLTIIGTYLDGKIYEAPMKVSIDNRKDCASEVYEPEVTVKEIKGFFGLYSFA